MEAISMAWGLLDLYNETQDRQYYDWALKIADTYQRLQRPDGSMPIKLVITTGEAVNKSNAMLYPLICYLQRLHDEYGVTKYEAMRHKAKKWMHEVAIRNFNMTGQFEDVTVLNLKPYENLTNCTAAPYADYLYCSSESNADDLRDADDLMRLSEDQFTYWDQKPLADGIHQHITPCVYEQYRYQMSVDNSACNVAGGFLAKYERCGDQLALAKAIALTNSITLVQNANTGQIPTTWVHYTDVNKGASFWLNCTVSSINMLLRMDEALKGKSKFRFYS
jgi:maltose/maltodextrin transport system substrate-binding protein